MAVQPKNLLLRITVWDDDSWKQLKSLKLLSWRPEGGQFLTSYIVVPIGEEHIIRDSIDRYAYEDVTELLVNPEYVEDEYTMLKMVGEPGQGLKFLLCYPDL